MGKTVDKRVFVLLLVFLITIFIRYENIFERPLGFHNEDATSHVLVTMRAFDETPISTHYFLPIFTLGHEHNKGIDDLPSASKPDKEGNYYYTSFPPFGFIAPYLFAKILFLPTNLITLRVFNLLLGLISSLLIFTLTKKVISSKSTLSSSVPLLSAVMYMLSEESLWSHANAYWAHSLLQPLWILSLYLFLKIIEGNYTNRTFLAFGSILFLMCYTEWTAFVMAIFYFAASCCLSIKRKRSENIKLALISAGSAFLSGLIMVFLFSAKVGFSNYFEGITFRAAQRKGHIDLFSDLFQNYWYGFGLFLLIPLILLGICAVKKYERINMVGGHSSLGLLLTITWLPMLENAFLLDHASFYTFDTLKLSVPLVLTVIFLLNYSGKRYVRFTYFLVVIASLWSLGTYFYINDPKENEQIYNTYVAAGKLIETEAEENEIAFLNRSVRGHLIYYAGRNIVENIKLDDAVKRMGESKFSTGKYFIAGGSNFGFAPSESKYRWEYYGYLSGVVEISKNGVNGVIIYPAHYSDSNWENGISRDYKGFFVHNHEILLHLKTGDRVADQNGNVYEISSLTNDQVWFKEAAPEKLNKATRFKLVY